MKFLVVKTSSAGDIVHSFPVLSYLKQRFTNCQIDWVAETGNCSLVRSHPLVNRVIPIDSRRWKKLRLLDTFPSSLRQLRRTTYDTIFDLQGNCKSGIVTALARGKEKVGFARKDVAEWPNVFCTSRRYSCQHHQNIYYDYLSLVTQHYGPISCGDESAIMLHDTLTQKFERYCVENFRIMVCPGSRWKNKCLSLDCLSSFLQMIAADRTSHFLFVWGSQQERSVVDALHSSFPSSSTIVAPVSLPALQNLMSHMHLVVAMDSLPLHLCSTTTTPSFAFFGPSSAKKYNPPGDHHYFFQGTCPYGITFFKRCSQLRTCKTGACLKEIDPKTLYESYCQCQMQSLKR